MGKVGEQKGEEQGGRWKGQGGPDKTADQETVTVLENAVLVVVIRRCRWTMEVRLEREESGEQLEREENQTDGLEEKINPKN